MRDQGIIEMRLGPQERGRRPTVQLRVERTRGTPERAVAFIRGVPDRQYLRLAGVWSAPLTSGVLRYLLEESPAHIRIEQAESMRKHPMFIAAAREIEERRVTLRSFLDLLAERKTKERPGIERLDAVFDLYQFKREPFLHQQYLFLFALLFPDVAITTDVGMGKTQVAVDALAYRILSGEAGTALVIAPAHSLRIGWEDEIKELTSLSVRTIASTADFEKVARVGFTEYQVYALSWNIAARCLLTGAGAVRDEVAHAFDTLIVDESHRAKSIKSKRTKAVMKFAREAPSLRFRQILTGTFAPKNLLDIYTQIFILDGGATFGADFYTFTNSYFFPVGKVWQKFVPYKGTHDKIKQKLASIALSFERHDCLDLPPEIVKHFELDAAGDQAAVLAAFDERAEEIYEQVEAGGALALPDEVPELVPINELDDIPAGGLLGEIQRIRLKQRMVCSGFYEDEDGRIFFDDNPKRDCLLDQLEDIPEDERVLMWCHFRGEAELLTNAMRDAKQDFRVIVGGVSVSKKEAVLRDYKERRFRVLIASYGTISESTNLQFVNQVFHYSRDWNFGTMFQSDGRSQRIGSDIHRAIYRRELRIKGTVEDDVYANLRAKGNLRTFLMRDRAAMATRRKR